MPVIVLCIVGEHQENKMGRRIIWCSEEEKYLIDILADEHVSQMLDTTQKSGVYKIVIEQMKERG